MLTSSSQELAEKQVSLGMAGIERNRLAKRRDSLLHSMASVVCTGKVVLKCWMHREEPSRLPELADGKIVGADPIEVCP
jgi:hypothetical protein